MKLRLPIPDKYIYSTAVVGLTLILFGALTVNDIQSSAELVSKFPKTATPLTKKLIPESTSSPYFRVACAEVQEGEGITGAVQRAIGQVPREPRGGVMPKFEVLNTVSRGVRVYSFNEALENNPVVKAKRDVVCLTERPYLSANATAVAANKNNSK